MSNKKSSNTFNHIEDVKLRTWNRCAVAFNIMADCGIEEAKKYMGKLDQEGKAQVLGMLDCIKRFGYETVRKTIKVEVA